jgi:hypothetical protein
MLGLLITMGIMHYFKVAFLLQLLNIYLVGPTRTPLSGPSLCSNSAIFGTNPWRIQRAVELQRRAFG